MTGNKISAVTLIGVILLLGSCDSITEDFAESLGVTEADNNLNWTRKQTILTVKGENYIVDEDIARDPKTHEIVRIERSAVVNGSRLDCGVASLEACRKKIRKNVTDGGGFQGGD